MRTARALRLIRRLRAAEAEVSDWEGEFLQSVEGRLGTYGRAFADPEKGGPGSAVSVRQTRKLKEIAAKVSGEDAPKPPRKTFGSRKPWPRRRPPAPGRGGDGDGGEGA